MREIHASDACWKAVRRGSSVSLVRRQALLNKAVLPRPAPDLSIKRRLSVSSPAPLHSICGNMSQAMFSCRNYSKFVLLAPPCPPGIRNQTSGGVYTATCGANKGPPTLPEFWVGMPRSERQMSQTSAKVGKTTISHSHLSAL
jgi:hypothetical protein